MSVVTLEPIRVRKPTPYPQQPRLHGLSWVSHHVVALVRQAWAVVLMRFIGLLGSVSNPGMRPIGMLQAWALRRLGVKCASSEIWIGPGVWLEHSENIHLGRRVTIAGNTTITARDHVYIGDDFLCAPGLTINSGTHDLATLDPECAPVVIGKNVWCGLRVTICCGVTIGDGAVIGACATVLSDVPAEQVAVGTPARALRDISALRAARVKPLWTNFPAR